jgi:hypothetical protein
MVRKSQCLDPKRFADAHEVLWIGVARGAGGQERVGMDVACDLHGCFLFILWDIWNYSE